MITWSFIMSYKVSAYGLSDIGLVRQNNEDVWEQIPNENFFVLADGMGGHRAGEIAAKEAVGYLCLLFKTMRVMTYKSIEESRGAIYKAIQHVNKIIYEIGSSNENLRGMGTTLCCVFIHQDYLIYGHVGDSRIYRLRDNKLEQLTQDHSLLRELIEMGQISEEEAGDFLYKNIITKAIGTEPLIEPTVQIDSLFPGDMILMCTDGLTDLLGNEEIQEIMTHYFYSEEELAKTLVNAAKERGGYDNVTVVIMRIQEKNDTTDLS